MRGKRGRPRRSIEKAREFGQLVEHELERGATLEATMVTLRRRDPRWGSRATMMRRLEAYRVDKIIGPLLANLREKAARLFGTKSS